MYVAVGHGLVVICSASSWRSSSQYIQYMFAKALPARYSWPPDSAISSATYPDGPVIAHGLDDSSFNVEGIADHITQAKLL